MTAGAEPESAMTPIQERHARIVIVGGGVAGLATAWALGRRGFSAVTVLEREEECFRLSSGQNAAILRHAMDSPATRSLTRLTRDLLTEPPEDLCSEPLVDKRGLIVLEGNEQTPLPWWAQDLQLDGSCQPLSLEELATRAPGFRPEGRRAWWFPYSGTINIAQLGQCLEKSARSAGVEVCLGAGVQRIETDATGRVNGVLLQDGNSLAADLVVIAAGAWAGALGREVGAQFPGRPTRRHLFLSEPDPQVDPQQAIVWDDSGSFYFRPEAGGLLLCIGDQEDCLPAGEGGESQTADPLVLRAARRALKKRLPHLGQLEFTRSWAAIRTLTEDDTPVVGNDPAVPGLFWVAALGGHGMSLSLGLGELAASMICGEEQDDLDLLAALAPDAPRRDWIPQRDWV